MTLQFTEREVKAEMARLSKEYDSCTRRRSRTAISTSSRRAPSSFCSRTARRFPVSWS